MGRSVAGDWRDEALAARNVSEHGEVACQAGPAFAKVYSSKLQRSRATAGKPVVKQKLFPSEDFLAGEIKRF